jgi:hypothetical protein
MTRKNKPVKPDDFFSLGAFQMARYGNRLFCQTNFTNEDFTEIQQNLAEQFPDVVKNIVNIVSKIADLVSTLPPEKVLYRAWGEMAVRYMGNVSECDTDFEDMISLRMVDYLQSVIVAIKPHDMLKDDIAEEDWKTLRSLVSDLFNQLNIDYQICRTALQLKENPNFDIEYETFYYKSQIYWCNIRGKRYLYHEAENFKELISPHSDVLNKLFGITAEQLINEILKIQYSLTRGIIEVTTDLQEFNRVIGDAFETRFKDNENITQGDMQELVAEIIKDNGWEERKEDIAGRFFGLDLFDLEKVTQIPKILLEELSWQQGEDIDFFSDGDFSGWPLRIWPIFKRPFIKLKERYYCFVLYSFLDNFYRILQKKITSLDKSYLTTWNQKQQEVSEMLPFKYLQKLLPNAQIYQSIYYKWYTSDVGKTNKGWCEVDGLLIYDDHLFIIEVKAGSFTYTSPANDFPAYIESIKTLVLKPVVQGKRFLDYLQSSETVDIYNKNHTKICQLSKNNFRQITICPITLDSFTELAAQVQHLKPLGVDVGNSPVWSISIDDLRVYSDIFDNPLTFLHFIEKRMKAFESDIIQIDDELDHLGLYIEHNDYTQYAKEQKGNSNAELNFLGYRFNIDKYFNEKIHEPNLLSPLKQEMPVLLSEIIDVLSQSEKVGRSRIASYLLNCNGSYRSDISDAIQKALSKQKDLQRSQPISSYGDTALTICCWQKPFLLRNQKFAIDHSRAVMLAKGEQERLLIRATAHVS